MSYQALKRRLLKQPEVRDRYENPPLAIALARAVLRRRRELGINQEELAERLGTSQNQVWRIESGQGNVRLDTLDKLREVLGLEVSIGHPAPAEHTVRSSASATEPHVYPNLYPTGAFRQAIVVGPVSPAVVLTSSSLAGAFACPGRVNVDRMRIPVA